MKSSWVLLLSLLLLGGCVKQLVRTTVPSPQFATLDKRSPFLKAHLRGGGVYVLANWKAEGGTIAGDGELLDANRVRVSSGQFSFPADSVALFETNVLRPSGPSVALTIMSGVTAGVAVVCLANPKACFGSCPTFYAPGEDGALALQAEGFSASIAPALEATDTDMLYHARARGRELVLRVTNEALETHVIRRMDLLAARRSPGGRVFMASSGDFRTASALIPPAACVAEEGDCRSALSAFDGRERYSTADSTDLARREQIELTFDRVPPGDVGLVISSRQTLLTTFLIYQALAYLGNDAGSQLAKLEPRDPEDPGSTWGVGRLLGSIEVQVQDASGAWVPAGSVGETGPLAVDTRVLPLPRSPSPLKVRLVLTRGLWRVDQAVLAALGAAVTPERLLPVSVKRDGVEDSAALAALRGAGEPLVTTAGDAYDVAYMLPDQPQDHELFLQTRGYYLEWLREEWLAEENPLMALRLSLDPAGMLRQLAPAYKRTEAQADSVFWRSRYVRH